MKYRLRPIEVEAIEMTAAIEIQTGQVMTVCQQGDFLVRNPNGTLDLFPAEAFHVAYESCDSAAIFTDYKPKRPRPWKKKVRRELGPNGDAILREMKEAEK